MPPRRRSTGHAFCVGWTRCHIVKERKSAFDEVPCGARKAEQGKRKRNGAGTLNELEDGHKVSSGATVSRSKATSERASPTFI